MNSYNYNSFACLKYLFLRIIYSIINLHMKIAYIVDDYTNSAGIERVLSIKTDYLVKNGYDVYIITCHHQNKDSFFNFNTGIKFHDLAIPSIKEKYRKIFVKRLSSYLNKIKPDITISTGMRVMNYLYEVNDGSKKILELHFSKYRRKYKWAKFEKNIIGKIFLNMYFYKKNQIVRKYDKFIVLTEEDKKSWLIADIPNIEVIPNPLPFIPAKCSDLKTKRIIGIGRFTYQKGFDQLLEIWSRIELRYPEWRLTLFGKGVKESSLEKKIKDLNLSDRIELRAPSSDIIKEFNDSSIFVLPSRYEGLPMVLLEAMICGVPPVCYTCKCGPRDVITEGIDGFMAEQGNADEFISKLTLLMNDEELRCKMGKAAHESIQILKEENVMPKWVFLFDNLMKP